MDGLSDGGWMLCVIGAFALGLAAGSIPWWRGRRRAPEPARADTVRPAPEDPVDHREHDAATPEVAGFGAAAGVATVDAIGPAAESGLSPRFGSDPTGDEAAPVDLRERQAGAARAPLRSSDRLRYADIIGLEAEIASLRAIAARVPALEARIAELEGEIDLTQSPVET